MSSTTAALHKENSRTRRLQDARHKQVLQNTKQWREKILPNWADYKSSRKMKDLCSKGIPPSLRGKVWSLLIGQASYKISEEYFEQLVNVADLLYLEAAEREETLDSQYRISELERLQQLQDLQAMAVNESGNDELDDSAFDEESFYTAKGDCSVGDVGQGREDDDDDNYDDDDEEEEEHVDDPGDGSEVGNTDDSIDGGGNGVNKNVEVDDKDAEMMKVPVPGNGITASNAGANKQSKTKTAVQDEDEEEVEGEDSDDDGFVHEEEILVSLSHQFKVKSFDEDFKTVGGSDKSGDGDLSDIMRPLSTDSSGEADMFVNRSALYDINDNDINRTTLNQMSEYTGGISDVKNHLLSIERDLPRTFPTLAFFHDGGPLELSLRRVLRAFVCFKTSIGYVQGLSFIVAMLLLYMEEVQAFRCLVNLIDKRRGVGRGFYKLEPAAVNHFVSVFDEYFKSKLPQLYKHMTLEQISSEMFLIDWNLTLFSKSLSLESAARIWDCYLCDGEVFIIKASLGILKCLSHKIKNTEFEGILPLLTRVDVNTDTLMENIGRIRVANNAYQVKLGCGEPSHSSYLKNIGSRIKESFVSQFSYTSSPSSINSPDASASASNSTASSPTSTASLTPSMTIAKTHVVSKSRANSSDNDLGLENNLQSKLKSLFKLS